MATEIVHIIDPDNGDGTDYLSLNAWESAQQRNLVSADEIAIAKCRTTGGSADTTNVVINGWTADSTRYIKIWTDPDEGYRHNGVYSGTNFYRLIVTSELDIRTAYTQLIGIVVVTNVDADCVHAYSTNILIGNCMILNQYTGSNWREAIYKDINNNPTTIYNCLLTIRNTFFFGSTVEVAAEFEFPVGIITAYNITGINESSGNSLVFHSNGAEVYLILKNCLAHSINSNANQFQEDNSGNITADYCSSSDDTSDDFGGTGNRINQTYSFVSEGSNYNLTSNDAGAKGYGTKNPASGLYLDDIRGRKRFGKWDIGAFQYLEIGKMNNISQKNISKINGISYINLEKVNGKEL